MGGESEKWVKLKTAFSESSAEGLLCLDLMTDSLTEEPTFAYWKDFARAYLLLFAAIENLDQRDLKKDPVKIDLPLEDLDRFRSILPPMKGAEYITEEALSLLWRQLEEALQLAILNSGQGTLEYFETRQVSVNLLGRVCFHLAENKQSSERPFAFLATYAHQVSKKGSTQHVPLYQALNEYSGVQHQSLFFRLLLPVQKASKDSAFIHH